MPDFRELRDRARDAFLRVLFQRTTLTSYLLALMITSIAILMRLGIAPISAGLPFISFFPAVTLSALIGGIRPGLLSALISAIIATVYFLPPVGSGAVMVYSLALFLFEAVLVCLCTEMMREFFWEKVQATEVLGALVTELTAVNRALGEAKTLAEMRAQRAEVVEAELAQTLAELHTLIETVPAPIFIAHDPECRSITGNRAAYELLRSPIGTNISSSSSDYAVGRGFDVFHNGALVAAEDLPIQRATRGQDIREHEHEMRFQDGSSVWIFGNATALRNQEGACLGAVGAFIDITRLKHQEAALSEARREADMANSAKSRFLAAASHDLRQPLQALNLFVAVLAGQLEPSQTSVMMHIEKCLASLNELLSDLLDLSKLDAGVVALTVGEFSTSAVIDRVCSTHAPAALTKGLRLRGVKTSLVGRTDQVVLERVLGNLVSNAVRYTRQGGVVVGCRRRQGRAWLEVYDSGIGIPDHQLDEIFQEFHQLDNSERSREKGSGLGLAIVKKSAALLGLEIRVSSQLGRGSIFGVQLPLAQAIDAI